MSRKIHLFVSLSTMLISGHLYAGGLCSDVFTSRMSLGVSTGAPSTHFALLPFSEKRGQTELYAVRDGKASFLLKGRAVQNAWKDQEQILRLSGDIFGLTSQVYRTGPMNYLQVYKYNPGKNIMDFYGEVPVLEHPVYGKAQRTVFPLDKTSFIVTDSFYNFVSPHKEYLSQNPDIQFMVVEVSEKGMTRKVGHFSDREKIAEGYGQGVSAGGISPHEIVLFDQFKARVFRNDQNGFRAEEVIEINLKDRENLKYSDLKFVRNSENAFSIESSKGEVVQFEKFNGVFQVINQNKSVE